MTEDELDDLELKRKYGSFADNHPILTWIILIGFILFAWAPIILIGIEHGL